MIHDGRDDFGGYLEDFKAGDVFKHWARQDHHGEGQSPVHAADDEHEPASTSMRHYMKDHPHGKILVNGMLVFSLVVGISVRDTSGKAIANLEYENATHDGPTFEGDTIYAESEILDVRVSKSRPDRGIVYMESRGINQRGEQVLTLRRRFLVTKRPAPSDAVAAQSDD